MYENNGGIAPFRHGRGREPHIGEYFCGLSVIFGSVVKNRFRRAVGVCIIARLALFDGNGAIKKFFRIPHQILADKRRIFRF